MKRLAGLTVLLALALAAPASAHQGNPNFLSKLNAVDPAINGVSLQVLNYDDSLELTNHSNETITVVGYNDEPYARILPDGTVEENHNSPAFYLNEDRLGSGEVPEGVDKDSAPDWQEVDKTSRFSWHDHRIHYMGTGTPKQVTDKAATTKVFDWKVPLEADGKPMEASGTLYWKPLPGGGPPVAAIGALVLIALVGGAFVIVVRRRRGGDGPAKEAW